MGWGEVAVNALTNSSSIKRAAGGCLFTAEKQKGAFYDAPFARPEAVNASSLPGISL